MPGADMQDVQKIAEDIVAREGGFVNDPDDPGGATNHGVTIHTMRRLGLDLNGDGQVDANDVRMLRRNQAVEIFLQHYFYGPEIDKLPEPLQPSVFDMYVNAGSNAVKILQRLLKEMGQVVSVDGVIGPHLMAAAVLAAASPDYLVESYGIARRNYYYRLGEQRVASRKYARRRDGGKGGWIRRAEEFISPRYHLTDREHRERVAGWG